MSVRSFSYADWQARRNRGRARLAKLDAGLPPYRRERVRSAVEAAALRNAGTPEALIGPVGSVEEVAAERAELVAFARRLRSAATGRDKPAPGPSR